MIKIKSKLLLLLLVSSSLIVAFSNIQFAHAIVPVSFNTANGYGANPSWSVNGSAFNDGTYYYEFGDVLFVTFYPLSWAGWLLKYMTVDNVIQGTVPPYGESGMNPMNFTVGVSGNGVKALLYNPSPTPSPSPSPTPTPTPTITPSPTPTPIGTATPTPMASFSWPPATNTPSPTPTPLPTPPPYRSGMEIHTAINGTIIDFKVNQRLMIGDLIRDTQIYFTISSGEFNGTCWLNVDDTLGNFTVVTTDSGSIFMSNTNNAVVVTSNDAQFSGTFSTSFTSGVTFMVTWVISTSPSFVNPFTSSINTDWLWSLLLSYDVVGFILGCWTYSLGQSFYVMVLLIVGGLFYIKTKNLLYMAIIWMIFGGLMIGIVGIAMASPMIYFLVAFGIAVALYKLFNHST